MIEQAIQALTKVAADYLSEFTGEDYKCDAIFVSMENASLVANNDAKELKMFIRPTMIAFDEQNRRTRRAMTVGSVGDTDHEIVNVVMMKIALECKVPLYKGIPQLFKLLPAIISMQTQGKLGFSLKYRVGDETFENAITVRVPGMVGEIEIPEIEMDVSEGEKPVSFTLEMSNVAMFLGAKNTYGVVDVERGIKA